MERLTQLDQERLLRYLDGGLSAIEVKKLEVDLARNEQMRIRLDELRSVDHILRGQRVESPSKNFTQVVMTGLEHYNAPRPNLSIRNGIFLLIGVLVAAGIATFMVAGGMFNGNLSIDLSQISIAEKFTTRALPSVSLNGKLVVDLIVLLNMGIAWIVLDRAILRPYFTRRMRT